MRRQCALLGLSRSAWYYRPRPASAATLRLQRRIDELYLEHPFYGSRQMSRHLRREGWEAGRHRVRRLMRRMGLEAIYRKPRTSVPQAGHRIYPYLLRGVAIERPWQVECADITYIPLARGFLYFGGGDGLAQPERAVVGAVEHAGQRVLRGGAGEGAGGGPAAGDLQHGPGQPVHERGVHGPPGVGTHAIWTGSPRIVWTAKDELCSH